MERDVIVEPKDILFIGLGDSAVCWYRAALPAMFMGADWVGVAGEPPGLKIVTGIVRHSTQKPNYDDYKVVVIEQPVGTKWLALIRKLQKRGIKVIYEIDDYIHGIQKVKGHHFKKTYSPDNLRQFELCMRVCDAMIVSTDFLGKKYRRFNKNVYICRNGIDAARYNLTKPERPTVNIGWAGATGHLSGIVPWMNRVVGPIIKKHENTCFVAVGDPGLAEAIKPIIGADRAIGTPFTMLENYPAAMAMIDIAIAPAGPGLWYRAKSDLRWLEASALGIPVVADEKLYSEIDDGVNGFKVASPEEAFEVVDRLVTEPETRERVGNAARGYARNKRDAATASLQWLEVARAVAGDDESARVLAQAPARA